jgi:hypothetical protein
MKGYWIMDENVEIQKTGKSKELLINNKIII